MVKNRNLTSDLREAVSKTSEVGWLLAPLTSTTFEELSTSSQEVPQGKRPTSEVSNSQSRLFPMLRRSNEQASRSSFCPAEQLTVRGRKKPKTSNAEKERELQES